MVRGVGEGISYGIYVRRAARFFSGWRFQWGTGSGGVWGKGKSWLWIGVSE